MVEHHHNALFCVLLSLFVAADKLQYQSLDAVNKEGMFYWLPISADDSSR